MPLPCWPILPPKITAILFHPVHLAHRAAHRVRHHAIHPFHRSVLHAAAHPVRAVRTACSYLPQWLVHAVVALPAALSLHAATPAQKAPSSQPPPSVTQDTDPAPADPGATTPGTSIVLHSGPGSKIITFVPAIAPLPPDPSIILAPYIPPSRGGGAPQSGGHPGDLPPTVTGAAGGGQPVPIPEPSIWLVLVLPVAVLAFARRRLIAMCRRR